MAENLARGEGEIVAALTYLEVRSLLFSFFFGMAL